MTQHTETVKETILIHRNLDTVYRFWRHLENLPVFMDHLKDVKKIDDKVYHWKAKAPLGSSAEWDAKITEEKDGKLISWKSIEGSDINNGGTVWFTQWSGKNNESAGTLVEVELTYHPPFGKVGSWLASLFGENPAQQVKDDLKKLKHILERTEPDFSVPKI